MCSCTPGDEVCKYSTEHSNQNMCPSLAENNRLCKGDAQKPGANIALANSYIAVALLSSVARKPAQQQASLTLTLLQQQQQRAISDIND